MLTDLVDRREGYFQLHSTMTISIQLQEVVICTANTSVRVLVEQLGINVRESEMSGCDGWCLVRDDRAIIRINSRLGPKRRKFAE